MNTPTPPNIVERLEKKAGQIQKFAEDQGLGDLQVAEVLLLNEASARIETDAATIRELAEALRKIAAESDERWNNWVRNGFDAGAVLDAVRKPGEIATSTLSRLNLEGE